MAMDRRSLIPDPTFWGRFQHLMPGLFTPEGELLSSIGQEALLELVIHAEEGPDEGPIRYGLAWIAAHHADRFGDAERDFVREEMRRLGIVPIDRPAPLPPVARLAAMSTSDRRTLEENALIALSGAWMMAGGGVVEEADLIRELAAGRQVVHEAPPVRSELWGEIDPSRLNRGLEAFSGPEGQVLLSAAVAVATGKYNIATRKFAIKLAAARHERHTAMMKKLGWKTLLVDWRRASYLVQLFHEPRFLDQYRGEEGYDRFAVDFFEGSSSGARLAASALLSKDAFTALEWGRSKRTSVQQQDDVRRLLREGIASGRYVGEEGYDRFALDRYQGKSPQAWSAASSLLAADEFAVLGWRMQKITRVQEQEGVRRALREGIASGRYVGEAGYDRFALDHADGRLHAAWQLARSLLPPEAFRELRWEKCKKTSVQEQEGLRQALREGIASGRYVGEEGYDRFALDHCESDSQRAWSVAFSLLTANEFEVLRWGRMKYTPLWEQEEIRQALREGISSGSLIGEAGYDRFALDRFQGDSLKAWKVARSVLPSEIFVQLRWPRAKYTRMQGQEEIRQALREGIASGRYVGEEGYDQFALDRFQGESHEAWVVASSLLSDDEFSRLRWEKVKRIRVREQAEARRALREGIASGRYVGEEGYDRFALDRFQGDLERAWNVARSLLSMEECSDLRWEKQRFTTVAEEEGILAELGEGIASGRYIGEEGYDRFALDRFQGESRRAWNVASALLSPVDFSRLRWPKKKFINVRFQGIVRQALQDDRFIGREGRLRFVCAFIRLLPPAIPSAYEVAYHMAQSLSPVEDLRRLNWQRYDTPPTEDEIQAVLASLRDAAPSPLDGIELPMDAMEGEEDDDEGGDGGSPAAPVLSGVPSPAPPAAGESGRGAGASLGAFGGIIFIDDGGREADASSGRRRRQGRWGWSPEFVLSLPDGAPFIPPVMPAVPALSR